MALVEVLFSRRRVLLPLLMVLIAGIAISQMSDPRMPLRAKQFPLVVAYPMLVLGMFQLIVELRGRKGQKVSAPPFVTLAPDLEFEMEEVREPTTRENFQAVGHFVLFFASLWSLGFQIGVPLYTFFYLLLISREKWWASLLGAGLSALFLYALFVRLIPIPLLPGQLFIALGLV